MEPHPVYKGNFLSQIVFLTALVVTSYSAMILAFNYEFIWLHHVDVFLKIVI